ncbi:AsnC family protein [Propionibacterium cyclohexanicum]|uniref:AsnC family protein n=1 Tax=Propionibacterium cyclohexanicum TaxID=64702 RepID=A0A1H9PK53_9ACTN|nr:Lrp/AsnC ligand binding domain-containing protein [Propionibacterium cyclohexanicum]SER47943.1 AsnC family protein [Propionibacterium cyclohexanicum]
MITAIVFVQVDNDRIPEVAEQIAGLDHISEVYSVTGDIDLIAMVRVGDYEEISQVITDKLTRIPGVLSTDTHLAFRAYSEHDLEATFSL